MTTSLKGIFSATLIAGSVALTSCGDKTDGANANGDAKKTLVITAIPDKKSSDSSERYKPLTDYLAKELGVNVKYHTSPKYSASVKSFSQGEVQLAWFGGVTGVQARQAVEGAQAIVQGVVDPKYKSYIIAHKDLGLTKSDAFPTELSGKTFTFGSRSSTSGRVMPTHFIIKETGKKPTDFFGEVKFTESRSHTGVAEDVKNKVVQAGVISYKKYDSLVAKGQLDPNEVMIIWETPDYYDYNFTIHPDVEKTLGKGFIEKVKKALIDCKDEKVLACLERKEGLIEAKNEDFKNIVDVMEKIDFDK